MVEVEVPLAVIEVGDAVIVETDRDTGPGTKVMETVLVMIVWEPPFWAVAW